MLETIGRSIGVVFLAPPSLQFGNRTAQSKGKGHFSLALPSSLGTTQF